MTELSYLTKLAARGEPLVCPNCGGTQLNSLEKAEIWQPAEFYAEDDIELEAYDSSDVGDTETVGWACRGCITVWDLADGFPFITREAFDPAEEFDDDA